MTNSDKNKLHRDRISAIMPKFYSATNLTLDTAKALLKEIRGDLEAILPAHQDQENDYRLGSQTYGYKDEDSILLNLEYISDRWGCAFRIAWMLGIVDETRR